jgi:hypothetical protein
VVQLRLGDDSEAIEDRILSLHNTRADADLAAEFAARGFAQFARLGERPSWWAKDIEGQEYRIFAEPSPGN